MSKKVRILNQSWRNNLNIFKKWSSWYQMSCDDHWFVQFVEMESLTKWSSLRYLSYPVNMVGTTKIIGNKNIFHI